MLNMEYIIIFLCTMLAVCGVKIYFLRQTIKCDNVLIKNLRSALEAATWAICRSHKKDTTNETV